MKRVTLVSLALLAATTGPGAASAAEIGTGGCVASSRWTFSPPLRDGSQSGTATVTNTFVCVGAGASTQPPGVPNAVGIGNNSGSMPYTGSCHSAVMSDGGFSVLLIEGSLAIFVSTGSTGSGVGVFVLVPDSVCNESSATGPAVSAGAWMR
jgi:hypothetical protein